ncbi:ethanolamine kinase 1 isoform X2 [Electrophorus electricus]|uniref:ethanolamine kinase 1 isoform X2 n=1 Tax=Electrophorus electricus TaxID=8005 RepID=UPI0015CFC311|nr:ethanolamine kinase 1 isoform X2 [Electrophorus electricus]
MDPIQSNQREEFLHIDVHLDEQAPHAGIIKILKSLRPQWRAEDIQMKVFTEGITNQLLGCYVGSVSEEGLVLVRIYGQMTELFVDRKKETEILSLLHVHGCGPELYCTFQNGMCYEFVKGRVLDDPLLRQPSVYRLIAAEMGKIHAIKPRAVASPTPVLWSKLSHYLQLLQSSENDAPFCQRSSVQQNVPRIDLLLNEMEDLKKHLNGIDSPTVLCHNDLLTKNIIHNSTEGVNNVDYSLYPSHELQMDWLTIYLQSLRHYTGRDCAITKRELQELYIKVCKFSLASHLSWGLWALLQAKHSIIDFDFLRYATARFNCYFEKKQDYFIMKLNI